jgi:NTE family protein
LSRKVRATVGSDRIGNMATKKKGTVSLVLGSGGARGLAHIGVIHWLEANDFKIESISGCSIGAAIGGIYAAGKLDDFEHWVRAIAKVDIFTLLDLSWKKSGLVKGDKIINTLTELVGDVYIEDLPIKYTAVAADILNEKEVWINSGRLFDAIRASISLPLFFTPFRYKGIDLIDGGVLNPVPIPPTFSDETDLTLAVNLGGKMDINAKITAQRDFTSETKSPFAEKIAEFVESFSESTVSKVSEEWGAYDIANQAFDAMQGTIARQKLAAYPADHVIEIARNACGTLEFNLASEMIELGYEKAQASFSKIP